MEIDIESGGPEGAVLPQEGTDQTGQGALVKLVSFEIDGEYYAVPIAAIEGVMRIPPVTVVPSSPAYIQGIITVRGKVVTVIDLEKRFHMKRVSNFSPQHLILVSTPESSIGVIVDKVLGVLHVPPAEITEASEMLAGKLGGNSLKGVYVAHPNHQETSEHRTHDHDHDDGSHRDEEGKKGARVVLVLDLIGLFAGLGEESVIAGAQETSSTS